MKIPPAEGSSRVRVVLSATSALLLFGCHYLPPDTNAPPADACTKGNMDTSRWKTVVAEDCGVRLRLPREYNRSEPGPMLPDWIEHGYHAGEFNEIQVAFESHPDSALTDHKTIRQDSYEHYTECTDVIGGSPTVIQSYRGGGTASDGQKEFRHYTVEALSNPKKDEFIRIRASAVDRQSQEKILAAIRTIEFIPRSPFKAPTQPNDTQAVLLLIKSFAIPIGGYLIVLIGGAFRVFRRSAREVTISSPKRRVRLATYLALVLTPSVITDLFLFALPAPALIGFLTMLPSLFYLEYWWGRAYAFLLLYIAPLLTSFGILYGLLTLIARCRYRSASSSKVS